MSVTQMAAVFKHSEAVGGARLVLLALADVANDDGEVSAYARSQTILGRKAKLSERSVRASIKVLVDLGELEILKHGDGRKSADYRIHLSESRAEAAAPPGRNDLPPEGGSCSTPRAEAAGSPISPSSSITTPSISILERDPFDLFWGYYPRRIGKGAARSAWGRALKRAKSSGRIIDAAACYETQVLAGGTEKRFIPHPATWLNRDGWDDDLSTENQPRMPRGADATLRSMEAMRNGR